MSLLLHFLVLKAYYQKLFGKYVDLNKSVSLFIDKLYQSGIVGRAGFANNSKQSGISTAAVKQACRVQAVEVNPIA